MAADACGPFGKDCYPTVVGTLVGIVAAIVGYLYFWVKFRRK
ncbi:MAG TPA: hypothetical protein VIJ51_12085 [Solirubrobacteraceae bacterium]